MSQQTVTTTVKVMRNATMPWFLKQEKAVKDSIITLARWKALRINEYNKREEGATEEEDKGSRRGEREKETETRR